MRWVSFLVFLLLVSLVHIDVHEPQYQLQNQPSHSTDAPPAGGRSSTISVSPATGWTTGGEEITITGSGFLDLAFSNATYDGINHQWTKTTADYTDGSGPENAIVVDSNGHVHVVYINGGNHKIMHAEFDGSVWNTAEVDTCAGNYCWDAHMVIDDNDELHVAYSAQGEKLVYQHYDGQNWNGGVVSSYARFAPVGIAVDSSNLPHISYSATGQWCGNGLRLASFDGSAWTTQSVDAGTNKGCDSSIVIDENDHVYIAYQDRDNSKMKFATNKSGSWLSYSPDASSFGNNMYPGYATSLAMDEQGQFHIAHYDSDNEDLRYSTGVPNGQWTNTIVDASGNTGKNPSIAVDAAGDLHIVYASWSGFDLKYATLKPSSSSSWQKSNIQTQDMVGDSNAIYIDGSGMIHVAYSDDSNDVLKYATKSTGVVVTDEIRVQFGQLGAVTGNVLNDETIQLTTPAVASPGVVTLSLFDKNEDEHTVAPSFEFIDQNDLDGDGVANANDDCPTTAGTSSIGEIGCPDGDGDGYSDATDAFPNNANEAFDTDGDGVGDNSDAFPNNAGETLDSDGDGVGDNSDAFPNNAGETLDTDGDGVGDNSDAFPEDSNESLDTDGDGVGDNADVFPYDANESVDSDGDGIGDNSDAYPFINNNLDTDADGYINAIDAFPNDQTQWNDTDGDGYGDNPDGNDPDLFVNLSTQWFDSDGDGYGDNWGNASWNTTRLFVWPGVFVEGAVMSDHCPTEFGNSTVNGYLGCLDVDGNGIADMYDDTGNSETEPSTNETNGTASSDLDGDGVPDEFDLCPTTIEDGYVDLDGCLIDEDGDGVDDSKDACPETEAGATVNANGCVIQNEVSKSFLESLASGEQSAVIQTVGVGAILVALFGFLQTNIAAALIPDSIRWIRVLRSDSKLNKEEIRELEYLKSLVQTYYQDDEVLKDELYQLKSELTARYTNSEIKKVTLEKLNTLITDILSMDGNEVGRIAHNDAYFGLAGSIDIDERSDYLSEDALMHDSQGDLLHESKSVMHSSHPLKELNGQISQTDGHEYLEHPAGSGAWYYRDRSTNEWVRWAR
jgi:hypothetical protein